MPDCPRDGVLVKVEACGVCRSDHHAWTGQDDEVVPPHIPGHEFAGIVAEIGPNCRSFTVGDRVTAPFILSCGNCPTCQTAEPTCCDTQHVLGFSAWGAYAEYLAVPHADFNLVQLPEPLSFVEAAGMGCRVTTSFRALIDRAALQSGEWLAVHGCGGVGLSAIMIAKAIGAKVVAIDINSDALTLAKNIGADAIINAAKTDNVGETVQDISQGGTHVSVDALGITQTFHNSLSCLRKLGRHVQIGMPVGAHITPTIPLLDIVYSRQISLLGTRGMAANRFPELFKMITDGKMDLSQLFTQEITLGDVDKVMKNFNNFQVSGMSVITDFTQ